MIRLPRPRLPVSMRSHSLHARFTTAMLGIALVLSAIVAVVAYHSARAHYVESGEASARAIVAAVEQTLAVGVYARDSVLLKEMVEGLAHHPSVERVGVRDADGEMMASASRATPAPGRENDAVAPSFESTLASPFNTRETVGRLQVWLDATRLATEARRQAIILVGALIVLLAGVLGVFNVLARQLLSRPMYRLAREMALIEPGTTRRLSVERQHDRDEVGIVTAAANGLLDLQQAALERERGMREEITALEARYRGIFDSTSAGIFILAASGELLHANPALGRLLNLGADRLDAQSLPHFTATVFLRPSQLALLIAASRASQQPEAADFELLRRDGSTLWAHCMVSNVVDAATGEHRVEGVLYDITQRKLQEHAAQHRSEHDALTGLKSRAFIESALGQHVYTARRSEGAVTLMFIDLDGFKAVNDRWGHAAGDAVLVEAAYRLRSLFQRSCDVVGRLGGDELVVMIAGMDATHASVGEMAGRLIDSFKVPFLLPNGELAQVGASVGVASYPLHATTSKTLIHAADAAMYAVKQSGKGGFVIAETGATGADDAPAGPLAAPAVLAAQRDPLTGLLDRRQLVEQLAEAHARVARGGELVGVLCLDIDQFKLLNVAHGSHIGDEVLCEVARRFEAVLRRDDQIARTGSDEFVALVPSNSRDRDTARRMAEAVALKLIGSLARPFALSTCSLAIRASVGVSLIDELTTDGLVVLREAQLALRRSKSQGPGSMVFFEHAMMAGLHDRLALEDDLRAAIGTGQLFLHVQPQVDRNGVVTGGEALLRWQHPERGLVPPDQFIPLAESCGAIVELGRWVLRAGCEILVQMRNDPAQQTLAINVSPVHFNHPDFVAHVREALHASRAPAGGLILEITEGLLITDVTHVTERLRELVATGVRFSIDDFGTGFSSLGYLRQLPLYEIKIDRSFIVGLPRDVASAGIVCSILSMGSHLGLHVVAEGVETGEQALFLATHGCPSQQGWLHGRPMPAPDFLLVASRPSLPYDQAAQGAQGP
jgi:diguanylate cyclase (GGDEF)-like protein/PAS domain S-box-containing protein